MTSTLVIAEAGVNHDGDLSSALDLVDAAADAGADIVKFQTFSADRLATPAAAKAEYQAVATGRDETQHAMLKRLELTEDDHRAILERCGERGIEFLSTGFDEASIDFLVGLGISRIKVPSGEITNRPYLRHAGAQGLPVILSTGMSTLVEVAAAVAVLQQAGLPSGSLTLLHCTTAYPAPLADANLAAMATMREAFGVPVGYSDHTLGVEVPLAAVALGAAVIEKHLTLDRSRPGPDHAASMEPADFAGLVRMIRGVEVALGDGRKWPRPSEAANLAVARRSIVAAVPIREGDTIAADMIAAKRPGSGLSPMAWDEIVGCIATRDFAVDEGIDL